MDHLCSGRAYPVTRTHVLLYCVAAAVRVAYLIAGAPPFDQGYQWFVADNVVRHGFIGMDGRATSMYDPAYPMFVAFGRWLTGDTLVAIQLLQLAIDATGAVLLCVLTQILTGNRRAAVIAGGLYAVYPLLVHHAVAGDELSLLSVLLLAFAVLAIPPAGTSRAAMAGLCLGLAVLTRSMVGPLLLLAPGLLLFRRRPAAACAMTTAALLVMLPWLIWSSRVSGTIWPTRSGENLLRSNSRYSADVLPAYNIDVLGEWAESMIARERPDLMARFSDGSLYFDLSRSRDVNQFFTALAWEELRSRPGEILGLKARNVAYFFWPRLVPVRITGPDTQVILAPDGTLRVEGTAPRPVAQEIAYSTSYVVIAVAALGGIWLRRRRLRDDALLWAIAVVFVAAAVVYFPATRYRVPMEFVLLFYAAVGIAALAARRRIPYNPHQWPD